MATRGEVREQHLVLEDHPDPAVLGRHGEQVGAVQHRPAAAGTSPARARTSEVLPAPLGPITATTSPGSARQRHLDPAGHLQLYVEAHGVPNQRSRSSSSTPIETISITRLSASAASWSAWRVT